MTEVPTYTRDQVSAALNQAVDDINDAVDLPEEGAVDAMNLVVNAALLYLDGTAKDLSDAIEQSYQDTADMLAEAPDFFDEDATVTKIVLGWVGS